MEDGTYYLASVFPGTDFEPMMEGTITVANDIITACDAMVGQSFVGLSVAELNAVLALDFMRNAEGDPIMRAEA